MTKARGIRDWFSGIAVVMLVMPAVLASKPPAAALGDPASLPAQIEQCRPAEPKPASPAGAAVQGIAWRLPSDGAGPTCPLPGGPDL